jgi:hypothetical protein
MAATGMVGLHRTTVVETPLADSAYRGVILTHPSAGLNLFTNSVILKAESIHGNGVGSDGAPSGPLVDQTTLYDGWADSRFGDNMGSSNLNKKSVPFATRTRVYTPCRTSPGDAQVGAPTTITVHGGWDAYGTTSTDLWRMCPRRPLR